MQIKSELYIYETMLLLEGINLKAQNLYHLLCAEKRKAHIASFFAPWAAGSIWTALLVKSEVIMQQMNALSELREKIMQSEGRDDDMQPITLQQMIERYDKTTGQTQ